MPGELREYLNENDIQTNVYYPISMHQQAAYQYLGYKNGDFPGSEKASQEMLALPMYPELEEKEVEMISDKIVSFYQEAV